MGGWTENSVIDAVEVSGEILWALQINALLSGYTLEAEYFEQAREYLQDVSPTWRAAVTNNSSTADNDAVIRADLQYYPGMPLSANYRVDHINHMEQTSSNAVYEQLKAALASLNVQLPPPLPVTASIYPTSYQAPAGSSYTFRVNVSGGRPGYTYAWYWRWGGVAAKPPAGGVPNVPPGEQQWTYLTNRSSVSFYPAYTKQLKVVVTDSQGQSATDIAYW